MRPGNMYVCGAELTGLAQAGRAQVCNCVRHVYRYKSEQWKERDREAWEKIAAGLDHEAAVGGRARGRYHPSGVSFVLAGLFLPKLQLARRVLIWWVVSLVICHGVLPTWSERDNANADVLSRSDISRSLAYRALVHMPAPHHRRVTEAAALGAAESCTHGPCPYHRARRPLPRCHLSFPTARAQRAVSGRWPWHVPNGVGETT
eukprot:scaffold1233_cov395-Prasinococcus_capsulatus_cf.AAC.4